MVSLSSNISICLSLYILCCSVHTAECNAYLVHPCFCLSTHTSIKYCVKKSKIGSRKLMCVILDTLYFQRIHLQLTVTAIKRDISDWELLIQLTRFDLWFHSISRWNKMYWPIYLKKCHMCVMMCLCGTFLENIHDNSDSWCVTTCKSLIETKPLQSTLNFVNDFKCVKTIQ